MTKRKNKKIRGSVLVETMVAIAIFVVMSTAIISLLIQIRESQYNAYLYNQAGHLTQEGVEALLSIKGVGSSAGAWSTQNGFESFTAGTHYLTKDMDDNWELTSVEQEIINETFYRTIVIEDVVRLNDGKGEIDETGVGVAETWLPSGEVTKKVTVRTQWANINGDTKSLEYTTYLVNWGNPLIFAN